jgi:hypothetical protein
MLKRIFGPKRDEVTGESRKLYNENLNNLYSSPNIVGVIKSRMRWAEHVARMGKGDIYIWFWWGNLKEKCYLRDPGLDGIIILSWVFRMWDMDV